MDKISLKSYHWKGGILIVKNDIVSIVMEESGLRRSSMPLVTMYP